MELIPLNGQNLELKKHINAIHCSNNLSLVQRKLFNALLFNAYADLPYRSQFEIPTRALCNLIGYNSNDYGKLKKALLTLMTIAIEWNVIDYSVPEATEKWRASSALASAKLEEGICSYEYSSLMRELLYRPEIYGRLNMGVLSQFKSNYGLALYENCIRYQGLPQTPWFPLVVFRKLMGVLDDKYLTFKDFKKRVLNIAIKEVNQFAPLTICPEIKRQSQKVVSIRFKLTNQSESSDIPLQITQEDQDELISKLINDFAISPEAVKEMFVLYESDYIREKVAIIMSSDSFRLGKIRGLAGYLIDALKKDYKINKSSRSVIEEKRKKEKELKKIEQIKEENSQDLYKQYVNGCLEEYFSSLTDNQKQILITEFSINLQNTNSLGFGWLNKHGLTHPAIKALLYHFIKNNKQDEMPPIMTFDEFQKNNIFSD